MSAIVGYFSRSDRPVTSDVLTPAMDAVAHYGNDQSSTWADEKVAFGIQLNAVTPEDKFEQLPLTIDNLTITADARIDNRDELYDKLGIDQAERKSTPDSVLILKAFQKWGENCTQHLTGDYAFAIWNPNERLMFCGRDHIGARPFYYYLDDNFFAFATDIKGILAFEDVSGEIDEVEIVEFASYTGPGYYNPKKTFFKNVFMLPFGHQITVSADQSHQIAHWVPDPNLELRLSSEEEYVEMLCDVMNRAIADRIRTDQPIGAHISGGIDSSSVAILANRQLKPQQRELKLYSWSPPLPEGAEPNAEQYRIDAICRQEGLECNYINRTVEDATMDAIEYQDFTTSPASTLMIELVVQRYAQKDGVRQLLSGWGGDETLSFNGRGHRPDLFLQGRWITLMKSLTSKRKIYHPLGIPSRIRQLWRHVGLVLLPDPMYQRLTYMQGAKSGSEDFINPELRERIKDQLPEPEPVMRTVRGTRNSQIRLYNHGHMTARIESWAAAGAKRDINYTYPFLDKRVMEFAYSLPGDCYAKDGYNRYLYRVAMNPIFPANMTWMAVKQEPSRISRDQSITPEVESDLRERIENGDPELLANPWMNVPKMRQTLESGIDKISRADRRSFGRAMQALVIWETHGQPKKSDG